MGIILIGYLCKRSGVLKKEEGVVLNKTVLNITLPALILRVFSTITITPKLLVLPVTCFLFVLIMFFLGKKLFSKEQREDEGMLRICLLGVNVGLFAYPFVESIWGTKGMQYMAMFDIGNALMIFVLSYIVALQHAPNKKTVEVKYLIKKLFRFIPFISYIIALSLNAMHISLPSLLMKGATTLSKANGPLALLILGIYLEFSLEKSLVKKILKVIVIKYAVGFIVGIILFYILPFDNITKGTLLLGLLLPAPTAVLPYAVENKLNDRIGGGFLNISNVISFIFMWLIFSFIH